MSTQTIELDTTQPWEPPEPSPAHRGVPRWFLPAVLLVALAIAPLSSVPARSPYAPILTLKEIGVAIFLDGDTVYEVPTDRFQPQTVRAYDLRSGKVRWERHFGLEDADWSPLGGVLYQIVGRTETNTRFLSARVRAIDSQTGRTLWERPQVRPELATKDLTVLIEWPEYDEPPPDETGAEPPPQPVQPSTIYVVETRTGKVVTTSALRHPATLVRPPFDNVDPYLTKPYDKIQLAELSPSGELRITDLVTGRTSPPVQLAVATPVDGIEVQDGVVTVFDNEAIAAFDVESGRELWRMPAFEGGRMCGNEFVCITRYEDNGQSSLRVLRRSTNRTVFSMPNAEVTGVLGSRLLIQGDFRSGVRDTLLVDVAGDGRPRPMTPWGSARAIDERRVLAVAHVARGHTTIAIVDLMTGHATVVGEMREWYVPPDCYPTVEYILCSSASDRAVWRLPPEFRPRQ